MRVSWAGFYAIVDPEHCRLSPLEVTDAVLRGGASVVQLRSKRDDDRDALALAQQIARRCRAASIPFVMNDRFDLALLAEADGVHLGQTDLSIAQVRPHYAGVIGVSTHDLAQARAATAAGADLIGFGPIRTTASKRDPDPVVGFDGLRDCADAVEVPIVAIGGLDASSAGDAFAAGAAMVAAISAVCGSADPESATRSFVEARS